VPRLPIHQRPCNLTQPLQIYTLTVGHPRGTPGAAVDGAYTTAPQVLGKASSQRPRGGGIRDSGEVLLAHCTYAPPLQFWVRIWSAGTAACLEMLGEPISLETCWTSGKARLFREALSAAAVVAGSATLRSVNECMFQVLIAGFTHGVGGAPRRRILSLDLA
jgi:hypothetical protein